MDDRKRKRVAAEWLTAFGEPIDCKELQELASPRAIAAKRVDLAFQIRGEDFRKLLNKQADERWQFVNEAIGGTSESLFTLTQACADQVQREAGHPAAGAAEALSVVHLATGGDLAKLRRQAEAWRNALPRWVRTDSTRLADFPLLWAAAHVARWVRLHSARKAN